MTGILGVHVGGGRVGAVVVGDDGAMVPVPLGDTGPTTVAAVRREADGAMVVGEVAARGDDAVHDPVEQAVAGEREPLTALVAHVVGRATATTGATAGRLAFVIPDELDAVQRDRVVAAVAAAGIVDVVAVPRTVADSARPGDSAASADRPAELLVAAGAALTVRRMPPPIVTREDVDGPMPATPVAPPPADTGPPVSIFDDDDDDGDEPSPVRRVEEAAAVPPTPTPTPAAAPPTTAMPTVAGPGGPRPPREREFAHAPDRRVPLWVIMSFAVVLVAILAVVALLVLDGGDGETTTDGSTTTTEEPTPTDAPTSSTSSSTSSTSSTSTSTSSTTSSTTTSSTTTVPQPVAEPGPVTLVETGLQLDTGTVLGFGQSGDTVLDELSAVLGDPDEDTGWEATNLCDGDLTRFVRWGRLEIVIGADAADSDGDDDEAGDPVPADDGRFVEWYAGGADDPVGLVTRDGLGVGATIGFLEVNYGSTLQLEPAFEGATEGVFAVANNATGGTIVGVTDGLGPDDTITEMWAGDACQRTFL